MDEEEDKGTTPTWTTERGKRKNFRAKLSEVHVVMGVLVE